MAEDCTPTCPLASPVQQNALYRDLGRMEEKLDSLIDLQKENAERHDDLARRIEVLEAAKNWTLGAAAAFGAAGAFLLKILWPPPH